MSLLDRISGQEMPKIPVLQFVAAIREYSDGKITEATLKTEFGISAGSDLSEWNTLKGLYDVSADKPNFLLVLGNIAYLAERSMFGYEVKANVQARLNGLP